MRVLPAGQEHILQQCAKEQKPEEHKQKFLQAVSDLSKAFALSVPHEKAIEILDDVGFFQAVRAALIKRTIRKYQNRAIEAAAVIEELIALAREMREADRRGEELGLSEDERAFYDALEVSDSAVKVLGDETLKLIAQELVKTIRNSVTIDWTEREAVRAQIRVAVKRILRRYGYPPDKQEKATQTVLRQAELLCADWAA